MRWDRLASRSTTSEMRYGERVRRSVMTAVHCIRYGLPLLRAADGDALSSTALSTKHRPPGYRLYDCQVGSASLTQKPCPPHLAPEGMLVNAMRRCLPSSRSRGADQECRRRPMTRTRYRVMAIDLDRRSTGRVVCPRSRRSRPLLRVPSEYVHDRRQPKCGWRALLFKPALRSQLNYGMGHEVLTPCSSWPRDR